MMINGTLQHSTLWITMKADKLDAVGVWVILAVVLVIGVMVSLVLDP